MMCVSIFISSMMTGIRANMNERAESAYIEKRRSLIVTLLRADPAEPDRLPAFFLPQLVADPLRKDLE